MKFDIIKVRRQLHGMPELGFEEHQTSRLIAQILRSFGLEVHENIAQTGVIEVLRGQDEILPVLGYRADMDALHCKSYQHVLELFWYTVQVTCP